MEQQDEQKHTIGRMLNKLGVWAPVIAGTLTLLLLSGAFVLGKNMGTSNCIDQTSTDIPIENNNTDAIPTSIRSTSTPAAQNIPEESDGEKEVLFTSNNGKYYLSLTGEKYLDGQGSCTISVTDQNKKEVDMAKMLGSNEVGCSSGMGNFSSDFVRWANGNKMVFKLGGKMAVADIALLTLQYYPDVGIKNTFADVSKDLKYWLYELQDGGAGVKYNLYNEKGVLVKNISYTYGANAYSSVMYDEVNYGFLFVTVGQDSKDANTDNFWTNFDFLNLSNLTVKTLLKTEPIQIGGRGCYREHLESVSGTVIIKMNSASCIMIDNKYREKDGTVRLKI